MSAYSSWIIPICEYMKAPSTHRQYRCVTDHSKWCECVKDFIMIWYVVCCVAIIATTPSGKHFFSILFLFHLWNEWYQKCNFGSFHSCSFIWLKSYGWFLNSFRSPLMLLVQRKKKKEEEKNKDEKYVQMCSYHASFPHMAMRTE